MPKLRRKPSNKKPTEAQRQAQLGKALVNIYESGYLDRPTAYRQSFIKGVLGGFGGVLGATVLIAILLWVCTLFQEVPLVSRFTRAIEQSIQAGQK